MGQQLQEGIYGRVVGASQQLGLTLVHFLAPPEPFFITDTAQPGSVSHKKVLRLSRKVDECKPLVSIAPQLGRLT